MGKKYDDGLPDYGFVKVEAVRKLMGGISCTTLDREIREGSFPPSIQLTKKALGLPVEVIGKFLDEKRREQRELAQKRV